jgi:hypothetical protein
MNTRRNAMKSKKLPLVLMLSLLSLFAGCGGSGGGDSGGGSNSTGTLSLSMTDASTERFKAIYVTIDEVQVHLPGGTADNPKSWQPVDMPRTPMTVNLLDLVNGVREDLGIAVLGQGTYTQMRLIIGNSPDNSLNIFSQHHPYANYVIDQSNPANVYELKVPSGSQTGFKVVAGFEINANDTTELILDFDANRSVIEAGNSGQWLLKPTVKIKYPDDPEEFSIISGNVSESPSQGTTTGPAIIGALVSAQVFSGVNPVIKTDDELTIQASTVTDDSGNYKLFVRPGTYNLVVSAKDKVPDDRRVATIADDLKTEDFELVAATTGTVTVTVTGLPIATDPQDQQYATLSFRQAATPCTGCAADEIIEVYSINVLNGVYPLNLPVGTYTIFASSFGLPNQDIDIIVPSSGTPVIITF